MTHLLRSEKTKKTLIMRQSQFLLDANPIFVITEVIFKCYCIKKVYCYLAYKERSQQLDFFVDFNEIWSVDSKADIIQLCPSICVDTHYLQRYLMFYSSILSIHLYTIPVRDRSSNSVLKLMV